MTAPTIHFGSPGAEPPMKTACQRVGVQDCNQTSYTVEVTCKVCKRTADYKHASYSQFICSVRRPKASTT